MKKTRQMMTFSLIIFSLFINSLTANDQHPIKIACVGDSITYGALILDRKFNCYPNRLGEMLGNNYLVKNFGESGSTLLKKGGYPYWSCDKFKRSLDFSPDIVIIMLGTNDTSVNSWKHKANFESDYRDFVSTYKKLPSNPRIILMAPIPIHIENGRRENIILEVMTTTIQKIAFDTNSEIVDIHRPFYGYKNYLPDGVHPNSFGAEIMAKNLYSYLSVPWNKEFNIRSQINLPKETSSFHGYRMTKFQHDKQACIVVEPKRTAKGKPWVWRARFWGHEPQVDIALLERGFHVVYCDIGGLYGAPQAVKIWNDFYDHMQKAGLHAKVALEGLSRGGLIIYNWAHDNPEKVACIYTDAPVCDLKSWPAGEGAGVGSPGDWAKCMKIYGFKTKEEAVGYQHNPIDNLAPLAKAGIPLLHVCGDSDKVVPHLDNTEIIAKRYRKMGGNIQVILKPGIGHHPHSLKNPKRIVNFILKQTGNKINFATVSSPSAENRGKAAGWGGGTWWGQFHKMNKIAENNADKINLLFFGDSITQGWTGSVNRMAVKGGKRLFDKEFAELGTASFGLSGDRTEHLIYRTENGSLDSISPKVIVLMIGVNNLYAGYSGEETAEGIEKVIFALKRKKPVSKIILLGCFPTGPKKDSPKRIQADILQQKIAHLGDEKQVYFRDINPSFLNKDGSLNYQMMSRDNIHLASGGYQNWVKEIKPLIIKLMK